MIDASYAGWLGHRNIGDEALYVANSKGFPEYQFFDASYAINPRCILYGGGTIFPFENNIIYKHKEVPQYGFGIGVRQERFDNRKRSRYDFQHLFGEMGISLENRFYDLPVPLRSAIRRASKLTAHDVVIDEHQYLFESDYQRIKELNLRKLGVRGPESQQQLKKYDIDSTVVGDPALLLEPTEYTNSEQGRIGVCLRGRPSEQSWADNTVYVDEIIEFCKSYSDRYKFVFLPFQPVDISINQKGSSEVPNSKFKDYCTFIDVDSIINEIANCDVVIGEKLHANVLAAACHTPFVSVEYSPKSSDFTKSLNLQELNVVNRDVGQTDIKRIFDTAQSKEIQNRLRNEVKKKRESLLTFAEEIQQDIESII